MRETKKNRVENPFKGRPPQNLIYQTIWGRMFHGSAEEVLESPSLCRLAGKVQLLLTSPPFPLNRKKKYGNLQGDEYLAWLASFGPVFKRMLTPDGSIVIEVGNSWIRGLPTMSTLATKSLLEFQEQNDLHLCQEFVWHNPAKLPTPAQWVNIERIRLKDNFTKLWWMSPTSRPKANNRNVLQPYSNSMLKLLDKQKYNTGRRPSEHNIGETSFLSNNGGAIPGNVITVANTSSSDSYQRYCRQNGLTMHPARMPAGLAEFFIRLLTDPGDIVLDPFGGSNTTGAAAEKHDRYWITIEASREYIDGSKGRFEDFNVPKHNMLACLLMK